MSCNHPKKMRDGGVEGGNVLCTLYVCVWPLLPILACVARTEKLVSACDVQRTWLAVSAWNTEYGRGVGVGVRGCWGGSVRLYSIQKCTKYSVVVKKYRARIPACIWVRNPRTHETIEVWCFPPWTPHVDVDVQNVRSPCLPSSVLLVSIGTIIIWFNYLC